MRNSVLFALAVILAVVLFTGGVESNDSCYDCSFLGTGDADSCADPFNKVTALLKVKTKDCKGYCTKTVTKIGKLQSVSRGCAAICVNLGKDGFGTFCCQGNRCNSAGFLKVSWLSSLLSLGALLFLVARR
eukprot:GHVU01027201.1.p1 GENE.GHVU01027201.1~~GHVU01027201.1.p1  ORF type:complete len:131 (+),score=2.77 GHVU01027201.1:195-587(+)